MELPRYKYEPLMGHDEIRVFELSATKRHIEIRIRHVAISGCSFEALSYVWGKPDQANKAIILNKFGEACGWIPLTMNLGNAMCNLRDAEKLKSKVFWIDQICINQQDEKEKNHQVAMMNQIYSQSRRVITYLGPAGPEAGEKRGIQLLKRIHGSVTEGVLHQMHKAGSLKRIRDQVLDESIQFEKFSLDLEGETGPSLKNENDVSKRYIEQGWEWLVRVAYSEWTRRLWIVQEQLLNKDVITLRGLRLISWDSIATIPILFAAGYLPRQYRDVGRRSLGENLLPSDTVEETLYGIWWDRQARLEHGTGYTWSTLFHNLQWYQPLHCADARDRVYAILAISRDAKGLGLKPDYSPLNTVDVLSKELSIRVLEKSINLELLTFAISWRRQNPKLPSWCLTLDRPVEINPPETLPLGVYMPHPRRYRYPPAEIHINNAIIEVKGRILDSVSTPSPSIASRYNGDGKITSQLEFLSSLGHLLPNKFSIEDTASLLRTITAIAPWSSPPSSAELSADENMAFHFWAYLRHKSRLLSDFAEASPTTTKEIIERYDHIMTQLQTSVPYIVNSEHHRTEDADAAETGAKERVLQYALEQGRRLSRTHAGHFCNAMYTVQEDDYIVALQGTDRLFAIRLIGSSYKLIGDIFVDGLMHGEAYENQDPDTVDYGIKLG